MFAMKILHNSLGKARQALVALWLGLVLWVAVAPGALLARQDTLRGGSYGYLEFWEIINQQPADTVVVVGCAVDPLPESHPYTTETFAGNNQPYTAPAYFLDTVHKCVILQEVLTHPTPPDPEFPPGLQLIGLHFEQLLQVEFSGRQRPGSLNGLFTINCSFANGLSAGQFEGASLGAILVRNTRVEGFFHLLAARVFLYGVSYQAAYAPFKQYARARGAGQLYLPEELVYVQSIIGQFLRDQPGFVKVRNTQLTYKAADYAGYPPPPLAVTMAVYEKNAEAVRMDIQNLESNLPIWWNTGRVEDFKFHKSTAPTMVFFKGAYTGGFSVTDVQLEEGLWFGPGVQLPEYDVRCSWQAIQPLHLLSGVGTRQLQNGYGVVPLPFEPRGMDPTADLEKYNQLIAFHKRFHIYFQERGDIRSANGCYVAMRSHEEHFLRALYTANPQLKTWFRWRMNQFLRVFSAYGTDPSQALIAAFYVILIFSGIYILLPSETDNLFRRRVKRFREQMQQRRRNRRWYLQWGRYYGWGVIMRLVNALALSANAFVTLGYGEIQAEGIARYLAVLQGLIGWFLLAIFSAALIGQVMQ